jgi:hypothetical protein
MKTQNLINIFGTASSLARFLGITPHAVYQWPEYVPRKWGYEVQARSGGRIEYTPEPGSETEKIAQMDICLFVQKDIETN